MENIYAVVIVLTIWTLKPIYGGYIQCEHKECKTPEQYCDRVLGECGSCVLKCRRSLKFCKEICTEYYNLLTSTVVPSTVEQTKEPDSIPSASVNKNPDNNNGVPAWVWVSIGLIIAVIIICVLLYVIWKQRQRRSVQSRRHQNENYARNMSRESHQASYSSCRGLFV